MKIYLIGSLRNPVIPLLGKELRDVYGHKVWDDWYAGGRFADDHWQEYETLRGRTYQEALEGDAANHTFFYDLEHLENCEACVLVMPAGKSSHLEFGWMRGRGKRCYVLFDKVPERWDVMVKFAHGVFFNKEDLFKWLSR